MTDEGAAPPRTTSRSRAARAPSIGDFATVVQVFKDAPRALSSQIRTQEFTALIEERTRNFVGRDYVFAAVDEALADDRLPQRLHRHPG